MAGELLIDTLGHTLAEYEGVIRRGLATFVEVGEALMAIRDGRLYREKGFTRFEDYCQKEWGWTSSYVNRQIEATKVTALLKNNANWHDSEAAPLTTPATESQARELAPLMRQDETAMIETWRELKETYGDQVTAARVKEVVQKRLRQDTARARVPEPAVTPPMPTGRYRCIVIDPPWPMQKIEREERPDQGVSLDYPVMSLDEIAALPIADLAEPAGCHVYLWVTQKFLPDGLRLFAVWGVRYQCVLTWVKNVGFTPFSWMYSTEHVLFGRVGTLDLLRMGLRLDFSAPVKGHSHKPGAFYERVCEASPGPRLEMFAREYREGFAVWGNEL